MANKLINLRPFDKDDGQAGVVAPSAHLGVTGDQDLSVSDRAQYVRFVPSRNMTISKIAFAIPQEAAPDIAVDVGIYSGALARLVSKGATTGVLDTVGTKIVTVTSTALVAGSIYYAAISVGAVGAQFPLIVGCGVDAFVWALFGESAPQRIAAIQENAHPLPATAVFKAIDPADGNRAPLLALRES